MGKKDLFYVIVFIIGFVAVIGLLMAWSDGYLDGTVADTVLKTLLPTAVITLFLTAVITFVLSKKSKAPSGKGLIIMIIVIAAAVAYLINDPRIIANAVNWILLLAAVMVAALIYSNISDALERRREKNDTRRRAVYGYDVKKTDNE